MSIINSAYFSDINDLPKKKEGDGETCIANISPLERQKRLRFGITQFVIALVILGIMLAFGVDRLWRLPLFFLFWASTIGYFQARDKT
ncbi:MAG TPA: hypothetical protein VKB04_13165 [Anaerolineales bacterium]|nr:hypothetical protein [Anaerolineales bacterium]